MVDLLTVVTSELYIDYHMPTVRLKEPFFSAPPHPIPCNQDHKNVDIFNTFRGMCIIFLQYQYILRYSHTEAIRAPPPLCVKNLHRTIVHTITFVSSSPCFWASPHRFVARDNKLGSLISPWQIIVWNNSMETTLCLLYNYKRNETHTFI